jgi:branched-chain amino acid transport system substrate-binding protein
MLEAGAEALLFVGNERELARLIRDIAELPRQQWRPILSHWGPTAGDLPALAGPVLHEMDIATVQTFSFIGNDKPKARQVGAVAMRELGVQQPGQILSAVGVAHAYDLVHLLARAIAKAGGTNREKIRDALENLGPYDGLIKRYAPAFTAERHEALGPEQLFMARWGKDGSVVPEKRP